MITLPYPAQAQKPGEPKHEAGTFQEQNAKAAHGAGKWPPGSGPGGATAGIVRPVAVEPGHAPFDALAEAREPAILDDRIVNGMHFAVAEHDVGAAITARDIVGLPGSKGRFMDLAV